MKKLLLLFILVLTVLLLVACSEHDNNENHDNTTDNVAAYSDSISLLSGGVSDYQIVRGDTSEQWETAAAGSFNKKFKALTGVSLEYTTDWEKNTKVETEIIIGMTNREGKDFTVDRDSLGFGGYIVTVKNKRIVIISNDSVGITAAIEYFFSLFQTTEGQLLAELSVSSNLNHTVLECESNDIKEGEKLNYSNVKAMWISQYDLQSVYGGNTQRNESEFTSYIETMFDNCVSIGINTLIIQIRPNADSMYPSEFYAPSSYVVGSYGNDFVYDPFSILIKEAHERKLSVHAWINPMRAMLSSEITKLDSNYPLKQWWDNANLKAKYLPVVDNRVYLNVGYPEVRKLIVDGANEILTKYNVDGLHMDDYFYPTTNASFDAMAFSENGNGKSLADWRRNNINLLVADLYKATKKVNKDILFGISPAGTMEKDYDSLYADIYTWCGKSGYIDYICPQIYFGMDHATQAFDMNTKKWNNIIKAEGVTMWIGMTLGKAVNGNKGTGDQWAGSGALEWVNNKDVLKRCLEYTKNADKCCGVAYFCYQYFWDPVSGAINTNTNSERGNFLPVLATIKWN